MFTGSLKLNFICELNGARLLQQFPAAGAVSKPSHLQLVA